MPPTQALFDSIRHESVVDLVVDQVEEMILQGILREGARLPSERDLAERFDVSRPKVREALKRLEGDGLIRVQHGEGTFVAELTGQAMSPALIALYARHGLAFYDYLEYRREQEGFAARLAATRATATDHDEIRRLLGVMEEAQANGDAEQSEQADVAFHGAVVNASHNAMLMHMMTSIYDLTRRGVFYNRRFLRTIDGTGERLLDQHRQIAEGVLAGNPDAAEAAARSHLDFVEQSFRLGHDRERRERAARKRQMAAGLRKP
ncbi:GntR family transcriptional regulator [Meridianimarinicoccus roseus]|jgi:GntR family transcriptional repressor for pyruvate dehydrogenase complex|uniref:Pyruvate dehydrogenase complex repressor n=1 Tax=Meridianimarinicoccus roseus TaxID=2072018 RepID=A0A2V2LEY4_9RHOB|nr:FadR/GntR family transcriptional regulator [Meridianimarinicoccus roseus]PWR04168.1 GntR family transcriptional regulator [Meridianimarinicoccus roseus]